MIISPAHPTDHLLSRQEQKSVFNPSTCFLLGVTLTFPPGSSEIDEPVQSQYYRDPLLNVCLSHHPFWHTQRTSPPAHAVCMIKHCQASAPAPRPCFQSLTRPTDNFNCFFSHHLHVAVYIFEHDNNYLLICIFVFCSS